LTEVATGSLEVQAVYVDFDDLWNPFVEWAGPVGQFCRSLDAERLAAIHEQLRMRVGAPAGSFTLPARAWYATGQVQPEQASPPRPGQPPAVGSRSFRKPG
jgi:hypothetical protein